MVPTYEDWENREIWMRKKDGISGSTVKLIGIVTMLIDHIAAAVLVRILVSGGWSDRLYFVYCLMRFIGRLGFPIFCFLLVEGVERTRSKTKYALRLGMFALLSEIPFDLAFSARVLEFEYQNVFFTLFFGMLALCAYRFVSTHKLPVGVRVVFCTAGAALASAFLMKNGPVKIDFANGHKEITQIMMEKELVFAAVCLGLLLLLFLYAKLQKKEKPLEAWLNAGTNLAALAVCMWAANLLRTDYAGTGVLTVTVMYLFRKSNRLAMGCGCVVLTAMSFNEVTAFLAVIPASLYNGKRGLKLKYFFYAFYPVHLLILWIVSVLMGLGTVPVV